jgi:hypothetical protein
MYHNFGRLLEIGNTLDVLIESWLVAEENLREDIQRYHPDVDEEYITKSFHGEYGRLLSEASEAKLIEYAFLKDLKKAFPLITMHLPQIARGLIAEITLHKRPTEKITGGDIGILIIRPHVFVQGDYIRIKDYRRGLLCQAKLKNSRGKWGHFTKRQIELLPERLPYLSLLLYSYDDNERRLLNPFSWQLCSSFSFSDLQDWLKKGSFPDLLTSDHIVAKLGYALIGTDNDNIIDSIVAPSHNTTLVINITWPDGRRPGGPGSSIRIYSSQEHHVHQQIRITH